MSPIAPIGAMSPEQVRGLFPTDLVPEPSLAKPGASSPFSQLVSEGLAQVNEKLLAGQADLQRLATGDVQNVHQVMIQLEESRLSFQLMMQVRGRLLEAYQDIMKMQI